jgi:hypothetical protein
MAGSECRPAIAILRRWMTASTSGFRLLRAHCGHPAISRAAGQRNPSPSNLDALKRSLENSCSRPQPAGRDGHPISLAGASTDPAQRLLFGEQIYIFTASTRPWPADHLLGFVVFRKAGSHFIPAEWPTLAPRLYPLMGLRTKYPGCAVVLDID